MRLLFFHNENAALLRWLTMESFCREAFIEAIAKKKKWADDASTGLLVPQGWMDSARTTEGYKYFSYEANQWKIPSFFYDHGPDEVLLVCGHTVFDSDEEQIREIFETISADVLTVRINPALSASKETARLTPNNHVVGFRRFYQTFVEPAHEPTAWPTLMLFRKNAWEKILASGVLNVNFIQFVNGLKHQGIRIEHFQVGGNRYQLDGPKDVLTFFQESITPFTKSINGSVSRNQGTIVEPLWIGENVKVEPGALVVGPSILSDQVTIKSDAIIRDSILGVGVTVPKNQLFNRSVCLKSFPEEIQSEPIPARSLVTKMSDYGMPRGDVFCPWSFFSYMRFGKRIFDFLFSAMILILLLPLFPIFIVMVKWKSPGPIFYRACRQGLHGRKFDCLKFRTMVLKAEQMQLQLRALNQVDGPQFKIENDPRVSTLGKFLRDTCIDELPQFINVLLGHMSIVGPRPSPENENESCPMWRDARLSVRPGITGPWQIFRTRQASTDFQEWIHYDTEYVRSMSLKKDIWICLKTSQKLMNNLLKQFG